ncbi:MAG TPA: CBS domain-containing protein [Candidatus Hydrothermia bacterium]|nr:CBS domain-containing protein [Candidatus Hydrothermae bacterium]MDD3649228.1 CBS domain-containing protein [Candidatus Hydrothermia bacterium]MDD5572432.1 CBS domain-containing protein [Candidatus Hydrothermia bacterium]HOK22643.1 CBS domain-containing protein [Candidatus Hydrothermia bacterium]HOL23352.1 CBS domain-containing protein [Candidatus Hydrothermia bacterium]
MSEVFKVSDIMSYIETAKSDTPITKVAELMKEEFTSIVPVVDDAGKVKGVIYAEDLLAPFIPDFFNMIDNFSYITSFGALDQEVFSDFTHKLFLAEDVMHTKFTFLKPDDSILKAIFYIVQERRTCIVVVDDQMNYCGIISRLAIINKLYGNRK